MSQFSESMKKGFGKVGGVLAKVGRRNWIIIGAIVLIGAAVFLNVLLFSGGNDIGYGGNNMGDNIADPASLPEDDNYFATAQLSRSRARDEALEVLQTVVDSSEALQVAKEQALADMSQIAKDIANESNIETMVLSKGFEECVAVVNGDSASVIVKSEGLLASEIAQIAEIVYEQTGIEPINIRIVENT